ncbi:MAG: phosphatidate cytidylyltransferase, partial [Paracoccaceae bacterium]
MSQNWDDLKTRLVTGAALVLVGAISVWAGGVWFVAVCALAGAAMVWELSRMLAPDQGGAAVSLAIVSTMWAWVFWQGSALVGVVALIATPLVAMFVLHRGLLIFVPYSMVLVLGAFTLAVVRANLGLWPLLWLVGVVVATDVAGYFAGRFVGGPKFWPRISPKKTWSGTIAGWLGAAAIGALLVGLAQLDARIIWLSVAMSLASQLGDIAESAIKRRAGVKDSSDLLPGHGGVLDRFDGMVGAGLFFLVVVLPLGIFSS